ncbi:MAG: chemotaxis protein CheW, partial [Clostridiales bacterium]|nr:chemotaxis protein CheW [Clostridiales bacterium]
KIIPVIDVRIRFKQEPFAYNDRTCIIVVNYHDMLVGLIVEKIAEVVEIQEDNVIPSPTLARAENPENRFVYAIGKVGGEVKLLLDPEHLLSDDDVAEVEAAAAAAESEEGEE